MRKFNTEQNGDQMLSRIGRMIVALPPIVFIKRKIESVIDRVKEYADQKLKALINLEADAKKDPNGTAKVSALGRNIVFIAPPYTSDETAEARLSQLMDLKEAGARSPADFFNYFMGANFFLSVNGDKGLNMRRGLVAHFSTARLPDDLFREFNDVFIQLMSSKTQDANTEMILKNWILDFLMRHLAGIQLTEKMKAKLFEFENTMGVASFACLFIPRFIVGWIPFFALFKRELQNEIKLFLKEKIKLLREHPHLFDSDTWFVRTIKQKLPRGKSLQQITDKEIERLIHDPDLRTCFALILGVKNITDALQFFINDIFSQAQSDHVALIFQKLKREIETHDYKNDALDANTMPVLHANFLEILRISQRGHSIARYTHKGIKTNLLDVPPKSFVTLTFSQGVKKYDKEGPVYNPSHFLDAKNQLVKAAELHKGVLTPFGIGSRMCAGQRLAEKIIKFFVIHWVLQTKNYNPKPVALIFNDPWFADKLETTALLQRSFFSRMTDNSEMQKSVPKLTRIIAEYNP